jgi:hypothetical protein
LVCNPVDAPRRPAETRAQPAAAATIRGKGWRSAMNDPVAIREQWRRTITEHTPDPDDRRRCARCRAYWPCWELAYAREQLILNDTN